ncbi:MAG: hypothetical protein Q4C82_07615 [Eubacteriales bacterium]|nr:hypothetical protein [Eubacteriales bacterium]
MNTTAMQEQRAKNMIWNAAGDYSFLPDFASYDRDGEPDLYFNCIIGAVHRYYDYAPLHNALMRMRRLREANLYQGLLWLGLEQCAYRRAVADRPLLRSLRRAYAEGVMARRKAYWDQELFDRLNTAHFAEVVGEKARLGRKERRLLAELRFDDGMDAPAIARRMESILLRYFKTPLPPLHGKARRPLLPIRFRRAAFYGGGLVTASSFGESEKEHAGPKWLTILLPVLYASTKNQRKRQFLEDNFGVSLYSPRELAQLEKKLCRDGHRNCHLHVTRGEYRAQAGLSPDGSLKAACAAQRMKNLKYHQDHMAQHMLSVSRLTERIRNVLQYDTGGEPDDSRYGTLNAGRVWRAGLLRDARVFRLNDPSAKGNLSVDLLVDASASQQNRQELIAAQTYIIAESLSRCSLPVRVSSFCTVDGCTVLHMFRDYDEPQYNDRVFSYLATGWNRDGLAIRLTGERMEESGCDNRILIVLSDCSPNDDHRLYVKDGPIPFFYDYGGPKGILDASREVSALRRRGVSVMAVCTGRERDLDAARQIYGDDVVWAREPERFADAVGYLIQQKIR